MGAILRQLLGMGQADTTGQFQPPAQRGPTYTVPVEGSPGGGQLLVPSGTRPEDYGYGGPPARPNYYAPQATQGAGMYAPDPNRPWASIGDIAKALPARALADIIQIPTGLLEYGLGRFAEPGAGNYSRNLEASERLANLFQSEPGRSGLTNVPQVAAGAGLPPQTEAGLPPRVYSPKEQYEQAQTLNLLDQAQRRAAIFGGGGAPGMTGDFTRTGATYDPVTGDYKETYGPRTITVVPKGTIPPGQEGAGSAGAAPPPPAAAPPPPATLEPGKPVRRLILPGAPGGTAAYPSAAPGEPGAPPAAGAAPGAAPGITRPAAPTRAVQPRVPPGPSPAAIPQSEIDAAHQTLGTSPPPGLPGAPPEQVAVGGGVPAGRPPAAGGPPAARGPKTKTIGPHTYVEQPTPYSEDGKVLQTLRTNPAINALVQQAGGDPDIALQDPVVGPKLQFEVDSAKRSGKLTEAQATKSLESDVVVKRWLAAAKNARTQADELYGPITDAKGKPIWNPQTGKPYSFEDVLTGSPMWSMFGESALGQRLPQWAQLTPEAKLIALSKDPGTPEGLRKAALRVLSGPTIRPKLAKATGEVGNLNTMEQTVFDSLLPTANSTAVEAAGRRDLLYRILDQQIRLLESGKVDPLTAANTFRTSLGQIAAAAGAPVPPAVEASLSRPRDHILSPDELAEEDKANAATGLRIPNLEVRP